MAGVSKALLKGKRGIMIDYERASVPEIIKHAAGMQGLSIGTIAMLAGIERQRFYSMLSGVVGISELELIRLEDALGLKIPREKLTPIKYRLM